jgi:hypothetical protein
MAEMKYIIVDIDGLEIPIIFGNILVHKLVAGRMPHRGVISAGFISYDKINGIQAYGKSTTLKVSSRPEDTDIIRRNIERY